MNKEQFKRIFEPLWNQIGSLPKKIITNFLADLAFLGTKPSFEHKQNR